MSGFLDDLPEEDIESIPIDYRGGLEAMKRGRLYARTGDCDIFEWQGKRYIAPPHPDELANGHCHRCGEHRILGRHRPRHVVDWLLRLLMLDRWGCHSCGSRRVTRRG